MTLSEEKPAGSNCTLLAVFERYRHQEFVFVEPGGNWGDTLIYRGAESLARRIGLCFTSLSFHEFIERRPKSGVAVYIHGSGGFNSWYKNRALDALLHALHSYPGVVIQGPQTTVDEPAYIRFLSSRLDNVDCEDFYFFAREQVSYGNLKSVFSNGAIKVCLDEDTALSLTKMDLGEPGQIRSRYKLLALREDSERPTDDPAYGRLKGVRLDPARYAKSLDHWIRIHAHSRSIMTNRTHSSILGTILGIPTTMLPGAYHKNRSVWEYSLQKRGVAWMDWPSDGRDVSSDLLRTVVRRVRSSYKVHRLRSSLLPLRGVPR